MNREWNQKNGVSFLMKKVEKSIDNITRPKNLLAFDSFFVLLCLFLRSVHNNVAQE